MNKKYDVIIIGSGPAAVFCALQLIQQENVNRKQRFLILDEGVEIEHRRCRTEFTGKCTHCKICSITHGFAGAGAFSDCKLSLYNADDETFVGGELEHYISTEELKSLYKEVIDIYVKYGVPNKVIGGMAHPVAKKLLEKAMQNGLEMTIVPFMHAGTTQGRKTYYLIEEKLYDDDRVNMVFNARVEDILVENGHVMGVAFKKQNQKFHVYAPKVVLATGRSGALWNKKICSKLNIPAKEGKIKIGVRYELPDRIMGEANELYEPKFKMPATKEYDAALTFCHNPYHGHVVAESYDGEITLVNGHADENNPKGYTNMALLFKMDFGDNAMEVVKSMAKALNCLTDGQVGIQRAGDFFNDIPTTREKLEKNSLKPTLESANPVNLQEIMPPRLVSNIKNFITKIDEVLPGFADPDNLIYGLEIKFSNLSIKLDKNFMTSIEGLYAIGDGANTSNGLIQASASGLRLGKILNKELQ